MQFICTCLKKPTTTIGNLLSLALKLNNYITDEIIFKEKLKKYCEYFPIGVINEKYDKRVWYKVDDFTEEEDFPSTVRIYNLRARNKKTAKNYTETNTETNVRNDMDLDSENTGETNFMDIESTRDKTNSIDFHPNTDSKNSFDFHSNTDNRQDIRDKTNSIDFHPNKDRHSDLDLAKKDALVTPAKRTNNNYPNPKKVISNSKFLIKKKKF